MVTNFANFSGFVNTARLSQCHCIYDPRGGAVRFFLVGKGRTEVNLCLLFHPGRASSLGSDQGWSPPHENPLHPSGLQAAASCLVRDDSEGHRVYTGDYRGQIWQLETPDASDDGLPYEGLICRVPDQFEDPRNDKYFHQGRIVGEATRSLGVSAKIDGRVQGTRRITFHPPPEPATIGVFELDVDGFWVDSTPIPRGALGNFKIGRDLLFSKVQTDPVEVRPFPPTVFWGTNLQAGAPEPTLPTDRLGDLILDFHRLGQKHIDEVAEKEKTFPIGNFGRRYQDRIFNGSPGQTFLITRLMYDFKITNEEGRE